MSLRATGLKQGLATLHLQHTSASLLIQENADPEVRRDLERFFARLSPDGDPLFRHTAEGEDDMPAHVRTALTTVSMSSGVAATLMAWMTAFPTSPSRAAFGPSAAPTMTPAAMPRPIRLVRPVLLTD